MAGMPGRPVHQGLLRWLSTISIALANAAASSLLVFPMPSISVPLLIALAVPATYAAMVAIEHGMRTGWRWPERRGWQATGAACFLLLCIVNALVSGALARVIPRVHVFDAAGWGVAGGTLAGYLILSLGNALLHASYHRFDVLWRHVHQLHHAPSRLDVAGVMYQTPLEMAANAVLFFVVTRLVLGLDPLATMLCAYLGAFYGMFQHFNARTPRWLGWFIQRPEAHCEHHRRGVHAGNYSDLPLWDMLAGTYSNPRDFEGELGFAPRAAARVGDMLRGRDVEART
jgi:sterol desaturase/sphingolipid hydroxylase (fatty acid hydroxylase superfamily)